MADNVTPRVDATLLQNFVNSTVRIIGRVDSQVGSNANNILTFYVPSYKSTNLTIQLSYTQDLQFQLGQWYEIIGRVNSDLSVRCVDSREFKTPEGKQVNETAIAGLVHFSNKVARDIYGVEN
ncbi:hypothetical protein WICPIJ_003625 [Wickerhamomyces pijperi]|uniref:Replication factor A protein 3 n=1 Tax=Wickerhamomyces pijperi TaxID=599730 RepID=A0A9P8Q7G8_WICPI|nr:hypothetical protein WICPIJ_003625 [Wickerhamomyces pijperi]